MCVFVWITFSLGCEWRVKFRIFIFHTRNMKFLSNHKINDKTRKSSNVIAQKKSQKNTKNVVHNIFFYMFSPIFTRKSWKSWKSWKSKNIKFIRKIFFGDKKSFRACLRNIMFNSSHMTFGIFIFKFIIFFCNTCKQERRTWTTNLMLFYFSNFQMMIVYERWVSIAFLSGCEKKMKWNVFQVQ